MTEDVQDNSAEQQPVEMKQSAGQMLFEARERLGLTIPDVARQLRLSTRQVEALEADDYSSLPGKTFLRGFIRNYAKLLQLDPEPLLAGCQDAEPKDQAIVVPTSRIEFDAKSRFLPFSNHSRRPWPRFTVAIAVAVVLLSWGAYQLIQWQPQPSRSEPAKVVSETTLTLPLQQPPAETATQPAAEAPLGGEPVSLPPTAGKAAEPAPSPAQVVPSAPAPAQVAPSIPSSPVQVAPSAPAPAQVAPSVPAPAKVAPSIPAPVQVAPSAPAPAQAVQAAKPEPTAVAGGKRLTFVFDEDSWVEVRDKTGKVLFSRMNSKGSQRSLRVTQPLSLVVGNAAHVKLFYNDKPVDLAPHTKLDVARLTIE